MVFTKQKLCLYLLDILDENILEFETLNEPHHIEAEQWLGTMVSSGIK